MSFFISNQWQDYELLDSGDGMKRERWGNHILIRPESEATWPRANLSTWEKWDGWFQPAKDSSTAGQWTWKKKPPSSWEVHYKNLSFSVHPTTTKQVGLFPEQASNWDWCSRQIEKKIISSKDCLEPFSTVVKPHNQASSEGTRCPDRESEQPSSPQRQVPGVFGTSTSVYKNTSAANADTPRQFPPPVDSEGRFLRVLNLFGYTGAASVAAAAAGAKVCHVDSSKAAVQWCSKNAQLCNISQNAIRFIVDDCHKFILREQRRGNTYDAIILDPPTFGRGKSGEVWRAEDQLEELLQNCLQLLTPSPLFLLLNTYSPHLSTRVLEKMFSRLLSHQNIFLPTITPLALCGTEDKRLLPCGITSRILWKA